MDACAYRTRPLAHIKGEGAEYMPTTGAALTARIPLVDSDERAAIPGSLVGELAHELTPADIMDGFRQGGMLDHRLHVQALDANRLVLTNDAGREFVREITATVSNASVNARNRATRLVTVLGAALFLGEAALGLCQALLILLEEARVALPFSGMKDDSVPQPQVQPHLRGDRWQWRDVFLHQKT